MQLADFGTDIARYAPVTRYLLRKAFDLRKPSIYKVLLFTGGGPWAVRTCTQLRTGQAKPRKGAES